MANTKLKRAARARQELTGERYTQSLARVREESVVTTATIEEAGTGTVDEAPVSFIFNRVQVWLKARGFEVMWRGGDLYFNKPPESALHHLKASIGCVEGEGIYRGFLVLTLQNWSPAFTGDGYESEARCKVDTWEQAYTGDPEGTTELIIFALETKLGRPATVELRLQEVSIHLGEKVRTAERERDSLKVEARKLRQIVDEHEGTLVADPWAELARLGRQDDRALRLPLYSTLLLKAGEEISYRNDRLFAIPLGQHGQGFDQMSRAETNLREGGRVPQTVRVTVVMAELWGAAEDVAVLREHGILLWDFTQTQLEIAPLSVVVPPGQTSGAIKLGDVEEAPPERSTPNLVRVGENGGVEIPGRLSFSVLLSCGKHLHRLAADVKLRVTLGVIPSSYLEIG